MKKSVFSLILFLCLFVPNAEAQIFKAIKLYKLQKKADTAYVRQDYNTALEKYLSILHVIPNHANIYWRVAECARLTRRYKTAEYFYELLFHEPELSSKLPLLGFNLASIKKNLGKYDEAIGLFQEYTSLDGKIASEAASEIRQIKWAKEQIQEKRTYKAGRLKDNVQVNTFFDDMAPVQYGSNLYYTTNLVKKPKDIPVMNVFAANFKDEPKPLAFNSKEKGIHTAYYAPNTEGSRLYYNLCDQTKNGSFNCKIYVREKGSDGTWEKPRLLDAPINAHGSTATQPNVGFDKAKGKDVLYFVSDRKDGGKGGLDIWAADIDSNGMVNAPVNLPINTEKDDITPFFLNDPQVLLFSTDGDTIESFGGFDIFKSPLLPTGFAKAKNMGSPMNSSYNDTYPSFNPENPKYYFVSNRAGSLSCSEIRDCVSNDIYDVNIKVTLDISIFLADEGRKDLNGCRIDLVDKESGKVINSDVNVNGNNFTFPIVPNKKYRLIGSKKGYQADTIDFNTMGLYLPVTAINQKMRLKPNLKMQIYVFDRIDRKALDGSTVEIRSEDGNILYATETLKGNMVTWDGLEFGKTYLLSAVKETYSKDLKKEMIETWSATTTKFVYKDSLYLTPFSGLPLTLYYDNDYPDPRSRKMTTIYTYGETFSSYYSKQTEYLNAYYKDNRDQSAAGANEISDFFQNKVKFGYDKFNDFSNKLVKYLYNGYGMEIVLEGYASPLAETEYNRILTSRRVSAIINHFYKYNGGIFRRFIKNGQLRLRVEPYGEDKADKGVSGDAQNRRRSVYSVAAMKERKVEIKEINVFQYNFYAVPPLCLYFEHDHPIPNSSYGITTSDIYSEIFKDYYNKKDGEYLFGLSKAKPEVREKRKKEILDFFENKVKLGYDTLKDFSNKIIKLLKNGDNIVIVLKGYTARIFDNDYNNKLAARRIESVVNYFKKYDNGVFSNFIETRQLRFQIIPHGEDSADKNLSDDKKDDFHSIYSVEAMRENKVEISVENPYNIYYMYNINEALGEVLKTIKPFGEQGLNTYRDAFLDDLKTFEKAGIIPKEREQDVLAIKRLSGSAVEKKE